MKEDMKSINHNETSETSVRDRVFDMIESQGVAPRPRYVFLCQNWLVWGLWVLSIMFGALAVAVLLFVSTHRYYDIYEAMYDNFFTFMLEALPYVWFVVFAGMLALAVWQLKHTRRGYRLSATVLGVSSFVFSLVLGGLFHVGGFGWSLDMWLGEVAPMYVSQAQMERKMWQNPAEGRLIGRQIGGAAAPTSTVPFADVKNVTWQVRVIDLSEADRAYLRQGERVRLLGVLTSESSKQFHACGVFPWMLDEPAPMGKAVEARKAFVDRMYKHHEDAKSRRVAIEAVAITRPQVGTTSPCHTLAAVRRVHEAHQ